VVKNCEIKWQIRTDAMNDAAKLSLQSPLKRFGVKRRQESALVTEEARQSC
jgi:hypothetical protein